jgi:hypothetical protein
MTKRKTTATSTANTSGRGGKTSAALPVGYANLLTGLKARVRAAQLRAVVSVNRELILLYWDIGKIIVETQHSKGYGKQVVERLARDLQKEFPAMAGLSALNLWRMRAFYSAYRNQVEILSQAVTESSPHKTVTACDRICHRATRTNGLVAVGPQYHVAAQAQIQCWPFLVCSQGNRIWLVARASHAPH